MRVALIVEYDGTNYHGFQYQLNSRSIQQELEKAISSLTSEKIRVNAAGRTDAGVHAEGQVVAFNTCSAHPPETFLNAVNYYLPGEISVKAAYRVPDNFDPRRGAISRTYRYEIVNSPVRSALLRNRACHILEPLDIHSMQSGAKLFIGRHDFARFCKPPDDVQMSTTRDIYSASVIPRDELVTFRIAGSSFLRHQVRRMAGSLVDVGRNRLTVTELKTMIDGGVTDAVANSLPARGLYLQEVKYEDFPPEVGKLNDD